MNEKEVHINTATEDILQLAELGTITESNFLKVVPVEEQYYRGFFDENFQYKERWIGLDKTDNTLIYDVSGKGTDWAKYEISGLPPRMNDVAQGRGFIVIANKTDTLTIAKILDDTVEICGTACPAKDMADFEKDNSKYFPLAWRHLYYAYGYFLAFDYFGDKVAYTENPLGKWVIVSEETKNAHGSVLYTFEKLFDMEQNAIDKMCRERAKKLGRADLIFEKRPSPFQLKD